MKLTPEHFAAFFEAVHRKEDGKSYQPFDWQKRLARLLVNGQTPEVLALPTAAGKTSVIDIAVFALACQAGLPRSQRTAPRRIFFIIDRRIVVDEATTHSRHLATRLMEAITTNNADAVLRQVAENLLSYGGEVPLQVAALRGGMYRDERWTKNPNAPTVCTSTVDQIGSRLLFRGYGISEFSRSIHAALVGSDALLVLDEAHLSNPFRETLEAVGRYQTWYDDKLTKPLTQPWKFLHMTATPIAATNVFRLEKEDYENEVLKLRLEASKEAELIEAGKDFEQSIVDVARRLATDDKVKVIGVVVNRVASARHIFNLLCPSGESILLTGRIRPFDRDKLLDKWLERIRAGRDRSAINTGKLFVVATQTIEVGANIDFDALVTEAATLDALRQRFGRLDRLGELKKTCAAVVLRKADKGKEDPVYGEDLKKAWDWLKRQANGSAIVDFGINALKEKFEAAVNDVPLTKLEHAPVMLPSHVDTWVQTSPAPHADPDPSPFLHGRKALETADVQIVWRSDLNDVDAEHWADIVALAPPVVREALPLPIGAARAWLQRSGNITITDLEGVEHTADADSGSTQPKRKALLWQGHLAGKKLGNSQEESHLVFPNQISPGATLVVPANYSGTDDYGWDVSSTDNAQDVGDECANKLALSIPAGALRPRLFRLRLQRTVLLQGVKKLSLDELSKKEYMTKLNAAFDAAFPQTSPEENKDADEVDIEDVEEKFVDALKVLLNVMLEHRSEDDPIRVAAKEVLSDLKRPRAQRHKRANYPREAGGGVVLSIKSHTKVASVPKRDLAAAEEYSASDFTDSDDTSSLTGNKVSLREHCHGVALWARHFTEKSRLPIDFVEDLELAGLLHDAGKVDKRFQLWLHNGDVLALAEAAAAAEPIAKSGMANNDWTRVRKALKSSKYPPGARHELASVAIAQNIPELLDKAHDYELLLYLIGTHHGRARPFAPVILDSSPVEMMFKLEDLSGKATSAHGLERLDSGWVERFWNLNRKYGYWGLAYLETLLRLADHTQSEREQSHD